MRLPSLAALLVCVASCFHSNWAQTACNSSVYCHGDLLDLVQRSNIFPDSKTFVDRPLRASPGEILFSFDALKSSLKSNVTLLREFVHNWTLEANSDLFPWIPDDWTEKPSFVQSIQDPEVRQWAYDINDIWKPLGRQVVRSVHESPDQHSLISVPHPFIVPGGRFGEFYYWDTYWIIKGLLLCEMHQTARNMVLNFVSMVERFGMVPNGGRVYYSHRSQPPLLTQMVDLVYSSTRNKTFLEAVLPYLVQEYQFWMSSRLVQVGSHTLNRYAVNMSTPRPESYREDLSTANVSESTDHRMLYSNLASAAESGWDFSSRWLSGPTLSTIRTRSVVPVDLNAIMCENEATLARLFIVVGNHSAASFFEAARASRQRSFDSLFWNEDLGLWLDWNLDTNSTIKNFYTSSLVSLLWGCGQNITRHKMVLSALNGWDLLSYPGGLPTSQNESGQQWDFPNVWAPHQWFPLLAWQHSSEPELREASSAIAHTWLRSAYQGWETNHTMFEKYNCTVAGLPGGGGEYIIQAGFGWTNGVTLHFLSLFPTFVLNESPTPSLGWISVVVLLALAVVLVFPSVLLCRWTYSTGKHRYWGRVHNEQSRQGSTTSDHYVDISDSKELFT